MNHQFQLTGKASRWFKGDMKEMMLSMLDDNEAADRMQFMNNALNDKDHANKIEGAATIRITPTRLKVPHGKIRTAAASGQSLPRP